MCNVIPKYFLSNPKEQKEMLGGQFVEIFFIYEEINLVNCGLCKPLSKEISSNVYWYKSGDTAIVCVKEEDITAAITAGKQIIVQNFNSMSAEYLDNNKKSLVLDEYLVTTEFKEVDLID